MNIGFYGGAFDPPHLGHLNIAKAAVKELRLSKLIIAPTATSPHKKNSDVEPLKRLEMARIAFESVPECEVSDIEIARGGVSYTSDTVKDLKKRYPQDKLFVIMGTDMFLSFHTWHEPLEIAQSAVLAVFRRDDKHDAEVEKQAKALAEKYNAQTVLISNTPIETSSTAAREGDFKNLLPSVKDYVFANNLYLTERVKNYIFENISEKRARHIFGVGDTAVHLAERYGADKDKAYVAGILHDITKEWDVETHNQYLQKHAPELAIETSPKLYHQTTGAIFAREYFGVNDEEILNAVRYHTTGRANMSILEKIVYIADVIEPNRTFSEVEVLRKLAFENIDKACLWFLNFEIKRLEARNLVPAADTLAAYDFYALRSGDLENNE